MSIHQNPTEPQAVPSLPTMPCPSCGCLDSPAATPGTGPHITLTGTCPHCQHALKVCQSKEGILYLGCSSYPLCSFRALYDPMLQQLRDQNARLTAELTLLRMQLTPHPEPPRPALPRWVQLAQCQAPRSTTTLGQALALALKGVQA